MHPAIRRARAEDLRLLLVLIKEFYDLDGHPYDQPRIEGALQPLLTNDAVGQVWLVVSDEGLDGGYAVVTWSWSLESGGRDCILDEFYVRDRGHGLGARALADVLTQAARRRRFHDVPRDEGQQRKGAILLRPTRLHSRGVKVDEPAPVTGRLPAPLKVPLAVSPRQETTAHAARTSAPLTGRLTVHALGRDADDF